MTAASYCVQDQSLLTLALPSWKKKVLLPPHKRYNMQKAHLAVLGVRSEASKMGFSLLCAPALLQTRPCATLRGICHGNHGHTHCFVNTCTFRSTCLDPSYTNTSYVVAEGRGRAEPVHATTAGRLKGNAGILSARLNNCALSATLSASARERL